MSNSIILKNVSKHYDKVNALRNVNLRIKDGEFFSLLGPSGSGKTTCLRIIAGFEQANEGQVYLFDEETYRVLLKPNWFICGEQLSLNGSLFYKEGGRFKFG